MKELKELYLETFRKEYCEICYNYERTKWPKAKKDAVGEIYEKFRINLINNLLKSIGIKICKGAPLDLMISKNGRTIAFEEDKAHYVDRCFLERFLSNSAQIVNFNQHNNRESPYFILHSPTKLNGYKRIYEAQLDIMREEIQEELNKKVKYFSLCNHDRVMTGYLKTPDLGFKICEENVEREINFFLGLK